MDYLKKCFYLVDGVIPSIEQERENGRRDKNLNLADYTARKIYHDLEWECSHSITKEFYDLDNNEKEKVIEAFCRGEGRNESDRVKPKEEDVVDYYEDNYENFNF